MAVPKSVNVQQGLSKVPETDPIPNHILLFLKYLHNKHVIDIGRGNCCLEESIWEVYFNVFQICRKVSFESKNCKSLFKKYGYLISKCSSYNKMAIRINKITKTSIKDMISTERPIVIKFLKYLKQINRVSGPRVNLGINFLHSEFKIFISKENTGYKDLNIEYLLGEYNSATLDVHGTGLIFLVPEEVLTSSGSLARVVPATIPKATVEVARAVAEDPIPNQILSFLKYLDNKQILETKDGSCNLSHSVWEDNFNIFRSSRKISFGNMDYKTIFGKYGYLISDAKSNVTIKVNKKTLSGIESLIFKEKFKFLQYLKHINRLHGAVANVELKFLYSEFKKFISKEPSNYTDLNIEHLLEEYANSKIDFNQTGLLFEVPSEVGIPNNVPVTTTTTTTTKCDPILSQILLFLKYLYNKKVIDLQNGGSPHVSYDIWEFNFNRFRSNRNVSFGNMDFMTVFTIYGYISSIGFKTNKIAIRSTKSTLKSVKEMICKEKAILVKFFKQLRNMNQLSGTVASVSLSFLHSEFTSFISKETLSYTDLNIKHLLEEYSYSYFHTNESEILIFVMEEILDPSTDVALNLLRFLKYLNNKNILEMKSGSYLEDSVWEANFKTFCSSRNISFGNVNYKTVLEKYGCLLVDHSSTTTNVFLKATKTTLKSIKRIIFREKAILMKFLKHLKGINKITDQPNANLSLKFLNSEFKDFIAKEQFNYSDLNIEHLLEEYCNSEVNTKTGTNLSFVVPEEILKSTSETKDCLTSDYEHLIKTTKSIDSQIRTDVALFLKYLQNKNVITFEPGTCTFFTSVFETKLIEFSSNRKVLFGISNYKTIFEKYKFLNVSMSDGIKTVLNINKYIVEKIATSISREKDILLRFLKHLTKINRLSAPTESVNLKLLHSEFITFISKETADFSDLNIEHLLKEYNSSKLSANRTDLLFVVPDEILQISSAEVSTLKESELAETKTHDTIRTRILEFLKYLLNKKVIRIHSGGCIASNEIWETNFITFSSSRLISFGNTKFKPIFQKYGFLNENSSSSTKTSIKITFQTLESIREIISKEKALILKFFKHLKRINRLSAVDNIGKKNLEFLHSEFRRYISNESSDYSDLNIEHLLEEYKGAKLELLKSSTEEVISKMNNMSLKETPSLPERAYIENFLHERCKSSKGEDSSYLYFSTNTIDKKFKEYSKGSPFSNISIVEYLLSNKWAMKTKSNSLRITNPDLLPPTQTKDETKSQRPQPDLLPPKQTKAQKKAIQKAETENVQDFIWDLYESNMLPLKNEFCSLDKSKTDDLFRKFCSKNKMAYYNMSPYLLKLSYISEEYESVYKINTADFMESLLNIDRRCYEELLGKVPDFIRHIYNTEFRFNEEREYVFVESNLEKQFLDFCISRNVSKEAISKFQVCDIFRRLFLDSKYQFSSLNGFLKLKVTKAHLLAFEMPNFLDFKQILIDLKTNNLSKKLQDAINLRFNEKIMEVMKIKILEGPSALVLKFICLLLRDIGFKLNSTFTVKLSEVMISLAKQVPSRDSNLRFLVLDIIDLSKNNWEKRTESDNDLDKEITHAFALRICKDFIKHSFRSEYVRKEFRVFEIEHLLEPRNLDVLTLLSQYNFYEGTPVKFYPNLGMKTMLGLKRKKTKSEYPDGEDYFVAFLESYYAKYGSKTVFLKIKFMNFCILRKSKFHIYYDRIDEIYQQFLNNLEAGSDESETSEPECDIPTTQQFKVENLNDILKNLRPIDNEAIAGVLIAEFSKFLCSKFNSEDILENNVFTVQLDDLKKSFLEFCASRSVYSVILEKLKNGQVPFNEVILAYDHKNIDICEGTVTVYVASDLVESFEASNQKTFKDILINLTTRNLSASVDEAAKLRISIDLWSYILKSLQQYITQDLHAQFVILLLTKITPNRLPNTKEAIELMESCSKYSSDISTSFSSCFFETSVKISECLTGKPKEAYKEFINQLLRENIFVTSHKNAVPLISVFCAVKGYKISLERKKNLTASEIYKDLMDLDSSQSVETLLSILQSFPPEEANCIEILREFLLNFLCFTGWKETILLYNSFEDVYEADKLLLVKSFNRFCESNGLCNMDLMYILFMTDLIVLEKHQSTATILSFKFSIYNQNPKNFKNEHVERAYKNLETHSSYSMDLSFKIIDWIYKYQPKHNTFSHDEIFSVLAPNDDLPFSKLILSNHISSLYFGVTVDDQTTISSKSFEEVFEFPCIKNMFASENFETETNSDSADVEFIPKSQYFKEKFDLDSELLYYFGKRTTDSKIFNATNLGCYICEKNFQDVAALEEHIQFHKSIVGQHEIDGEGFFNIVHSKKDGRIWFKLQNGPENISIERLILVNQNFHFVNFYDMPVNVKANETYEFDWDLPTLTEINPLFIIYSKETELNRRIVEEYCFYVQNKTDAEKLNLRSIKMPSRGELRAKALPVLKICPKLRGNYSTNDKEFFQYLEKRYTAFDEFIKLKSMNGENFLEILKVLVQMESIGLDEIYKKLSQHSVKVNGCAGEYSAELKLAKLPYNYRLESVLLPGDKIRLVDRTLATKNTYEGIIYQASENIVTFSQNIRGRIIKPGNRFSVQFMNSGLSSAYQSIAIQNTTKLLGLFLFPTATIPHCFPTKRIEKFFNKSISENPEQIHAVENISSNSTINYCPYILFGPPGTGKTSTIVESILHIFQNDPNSRILVSTFSNAACDQVGRRLFHYLQKMTDEPIMLRIYSACYGNQMDVDLLDDGYMEATNMCHVYHMFPGIPIVKTYRIIIATHYIVAKYVHSGLKDYFSHIFIDENGSSTIPDALCAIAGLWSSKVKVVLSGDPRQLGPILKNERCKKLGFDISLMERVMENKAYGMENYNSSIQTRLVKNFRSHERLLEIFNHRFYDGKLEACAPSEKVDKFMGWKHLPNKEIPLIFHESSGDSTREDGGTSLWNAHEIELVMKYVDLVLEHVSPSDIGIVSPYRKQYLMIKERLCNKGLFDIESGSTEIFQGKEKPVIIASTVRSNTKHVGFLQNKRRLNVLISRAEALLIVIGNSKTLCLDDNWKYLYNYCESNNCVKTEF